MNLDRVLSIFSVLAFCISSVCFSQKLTPHPVPDEFISDQYTVEVNGIQVQVFQASPRVHFVSFDFTGNVDITVNGKTVREIGVPLPIGEEQSDGSPVWEGDAVVRPLSKKVKVRSQGTEAKFTLSMPGQYTLEGNGADQADTDNQDMVLLVFANKPEIDRPKDGDTNVVYLEPGIHQLNLDLKSGQTLYLEAGAVLFGSIDVYDAEDVKILGRGVVYHYGPHSENRDTGYWRKQNWHPLTTRNSKRLTVSGVTFVARSRTWTIQMHTTFDANFDNVKVLGINDQNINGDGFDWVAGGGRTRITNSLIRSADDAFAFFTPRDSVPDGIVKDIHIENCVIWPTRANIFRCSGYGEGIVLKDSDIIHVPNSLFEVPRSILCSVASNGNQTAIISDFLFEDLRFEEPAALLGIDWKKATYKNIVFRNITMAGKPSPLYIDAKSLDGVLLDNVTLNGKGIRTEDDLEFKVKTIEIKNLKFSE